MIKKQCLKGELFLKDDVENCSSLKSIKLEHVTVCSPLKADNFLKPPENHSLLNYL